MCVLRSSMTLTPHPEKDVLMMFGGEYFDGSKVNFVVQILQPIFFCSVVVLVNWSVYGC